MLTVRRQKAQARLSFLTQPRLQEFAWETQHFLKIYDTVFGLVIFAFFRIEKSQIPYLSGGDMVNMTRPGLCRRNLFKGALRGFSSFSIDRESIVGTENHIADFVLCQITGLCHHNDIHLSYLDSLA
jgi:hypothetical protein